MKEKIKKIYILDKDGYRIRVKDPEKLKFYRTIGYQVIKVITIRKKLKEAE